MKNAPDELLEEVDVITVKGKIIFLIRYWRLL